MYSSCIGTSENIGQDDEHGVNIWIVWVLPGSRAGAASYHKDKDIAQGCDPHVVDNVAVLMVSPPIEDSRSEHEQWKESSRDCRRHECSCFIQRCRGVALCGTTQADTITVKRKHDCSANTVPGDYPKKWAYDGSVRWGLGVCDYILPHPFSLYTPSPGIDYTPDICAMDHR